MNTSSELAFREMMAGVLTVSLAFAGQILVFTAVALAFLFVITLVINALSRLLIWSVTREAKVRKPRTAALAPEKAAA